MAENMVEVSVDSLTRIQSAAEDFARPEIIRIVEAVIADLRSSSAVGLFGELAARHMWDEYCWTLQQGPFDDDTGWYGVRLGSLSGNWDDTVRAFVSGEVEKLPKHALIFLSAHAFENGSNIDEEGSLGGISIDGIVACVMEEINERASRRNLDLIGPNRGDVIGYEIEGSGMVWSALPDREEAMTLIAEHADTMISPDADLSDLARDLVDLFIAAANEEAEGSVLSAFLERFEGDVRSLLLEKDVLPALEDMRAALIERLDG
jgi:hypothetical protein